MFLSDLQEKQRADERTRTADPIATRVRPSRSYGQDHASRALEDACAAGLQYGCSKSIGRPISNPLTVRCFPCKTSLFLKWAMLGSNQRPPPCKRLWACFGVLVGVVNVLQNTGIWTSATSCDNRKFRPIGVRNGVQASCLRRPCTKT